MREDHLRKLKVETRMSHYRAWTLCKGEFAVQRPINPYVVRCGSDVLAKYLKISTDMNRGLTLREVKVFGVPQGKESFKNRFPNIIYCIPQYKRTISKYDVALNA